METEFDIISDMVCEKSSVLEVGCGDGRLLDRLQEMTDADFFGVDPFIFGAGNDCEPLRAEEIDRLDRKFDLIYSVHSFHHFENPRQFFVSAKKSLNTGGRVVILDWRYGAQTGVPERYFKYDELIEILDETNFKKVEYWISGDNQVLIAAPKEKIRIAIASDRENISPKIFGRAKFFDIYEFYNDEWHFYERRINRIAEQNPHGKTYQILEQLCDCQFLIGIGMGQKGEGRTKKSGHHLIKMPAGTAISESLEKLRGLIIE